MDKPAYFVKLVSKNTVYYPGDLVIGKCVIEGNEEVTIRSILVIMMGSSNVCWSETRGSGDFSRTTSHKSCDEYFYLKQFLYGNGENTSMPLVLNAGTHEYEFKFVLPTDKNIPTTFKSNLGNIRYLLKAEVDVEGSKSKHLELPLTVVNPLDVNNPPLLQTIENFDEKTLCCGLCKSGIISVKARIDKMGFIPGESFKMRANFNNQSNRTLTPYLRLEEMQTFYAHGHKTQIIKIYPIFVGAPLEGHSESDWDAITFHMPFVIPTINNCSIIKVEYTLKVFLCIPFSKNLSVTFPITIGTRSPACPQPSQKHQQLQPPSPNPLLSPPAGALPPYFPQLPNQNPPGETMPEIEQPQVNFAPNSMEFRNFDGMVHQSKPVDRGNMAFG